MNGGAWEYAIGYNSSQTSGISHEFLNDYDSKYYDKYNNANANNYYSFRILGDAIGEMGPFYFTKKFGGGTRNINSWYIDDTYMIYQSQPWFARGGANSYVIFSGPFAAGVDGGTNKEGSFRLVLAVK